MNLSQIYVMNLGLYVTHIFFTSKLYTDTTRLSSYIIVPRPFRRKARELPPSVRPSTRPV